MIHIFTTGVFAVFIVFSSVSLQAATTTLVEAKRHYQKGEYKEAHKKLNEIPLSELDPKRMALIELFRGIIFYEQGDYNKALRSLGKSVKLGTRLPDVAHYYSGLAHQKLSNGKLAQESFKNAETTGSSDYLNEKSQKIGCLFMGKEAVHKVPYL